MSKRRSYRKIILTVALFLGVFLVFAKFENVDASKTTATAQSSLATKASASITPSGPAITTAPKGSALDSLVKNFASPYDDDIGVVVIDTSTGSKASANGDEQFVSASIYKLFVAYDTYKQIDNGTLTLHQKLGKSVEVDETGQTIAGCLNLMITISDNDCGIALGTLDDWAKIDSLLKSEGYTGTKLYNYSSPGIISGDKQTTANDVAQLLDRLYNGTLLSESSTNAFIALLKAQTVNNRLPTGLPKGTVIAHKTGDLYGYLHDAGIIYGSNKNMIVVLMTGNWDEPQAEGIPLFTKLARSVWAYMQD